jgi:predicted enzyme related to lactoylglutathione lyase
MSIHINHITIDCTNPYELAGFWSQVTGWPRSDDDLPDDPEVLVVPPDPAVPGLLFERVPETKTVKNRVHLDIASTELTRDEEVERIIGLGASLVADHRKPGGTGWVVLADPGGNEFCVERSAAEKAGS